MKSWRKGLSVLGLLVLSLGGLLPTAFVGATHASPLQGSGSIDGDAAPSVQANAGRPACYLLDDPQVRRRMSAMFEEALLEACGRPLPSPPPPAAAPPFPFPERGEVAAPDVRINVVDPIANSTTQSETSISINRTNGTICANWNDSLHYLIQSQSYIGYARSTDGGQTWQDGPTNYLPQGGGGKARGDPSVAWRALDNRWYATSIHLGSSQGLGFWHSTDDCATFQWVGMAHAGTGDDKELMVIDNYPLSPHYGRMYIAWTDFAAGLSAIYSDNGTTWSTPFILSSDLYNVQGAWPAVAPNGDVYVAWLHWGSGDYIDAEVSRSTNGGVTFTRVTNPATNKINPYDVGASQQCGRDALNGRIRYLPSPQIAVGPNGCLHVVYPYDPDGHGTGDVINSYYRRSCDNGATWGPEVRLNDDSTLTDQFFPNVTVNENNVVAASWYDRRLDTAGNLLFDRYWTYSTDGGTTWQPNQRVSDVSSPVYIDPNMSTCYHGDYDQVASDATSVHIIWSDDRVYFNGHQDPDVWFERVALGCDGVTDAAFTWEPFTPTVGQEVTFTGVATGTPPIAYDWKLDVGSWKTGQVVTYTYDLPGVYTVVMTATNCATATATVVHTITVAACEPVQEADFTWTPVTPMVGQGVTFTATVWPTATGWFSETVDSSENVGYYNSMVLDGNGWPHISYNDETNGDLKYAYYDGIAWQIATVDSFGYVGVDNSLALDSQGRPHISYHDGTSSDLKYAYYDGSGWLTQTLDSDGYVGYNTSLRLDVADHPHISYFAEWPYQDLKYAYHDGTDWHLTTVDSVGDVGAYTSLALDSQGRPHISYATRSPDYDLKYAWHDGTDWNIEWVQMAGTLAGSSLALDGTDQPHISYSDYYYGNRLLYAHYNGTAWYTQTIVADGATGSSLVVDAAGRPRFSYTHLSPNILNYAWYDGFAWYTDTVTPLGVLSGLHSLALDGAGHPHIAYYNSGKDLAYIRLVPSVPTPPITYTWSLGDDTYAAGEIIQHNYSQPGTYTVVLTATNCASATATAVHTITVVQPCAPVDRPEFTWQPVTPTVGEQVTFTGTATGTLPISYSWKLDVGNWKEGAVVTYTYDTPGVYTVVLTATNCGTATASVTHTLTVLPPPCEPVHDVGFTFTPLTPTVGQPVVFTGTATGTLPIFYSWVFGDGGIGGGAHQTHTYSSEGNYTVLMVAANCTASVSVTQSLTVLRACDPVQIITVTQAVTGCVLTLGAELSGTEPFTYLWTAGALTSTLPAPTFDFGAGGTYTVTLTVGNCGGEDERAFPVTVACPPAEWRVYLPLIVR